MPNEVHPVVPQAGDEAVVQVSVATLWTRPEAIRAIDTPVTGTRPDVPGWIAAMDADQRVGDCVLSQLLLGEQVHVAEVRPDGWAQVIAAEQSADRLDPRGYPGWLPVEQLTVHHPAPAGREALVVDAAATGLHTAPDGDLRLDNVVLGTRLASAGAPRQGWQPVHVPGHDQPLWGRAEHLVPMPSQPPAATDMLAVASRMMGVPYVWGGLSPYGLDCSGLVNLAYRRLGVRLPRDARDQAQSTTALPDGAERPGDLYFFARPGRPIHHIGVVAAAPGPDGERRMLHACYQQRQVLEEALPAERIATLVGAHRV
ncbi:C40 family peptidase [Micromonospora sp. NPDC003197]